MITPWGILGATLGLGIAVSSSLAGVSGDLQSQLTYCRFGPKIKVVDPIVHPGQTCLGSAKIQGVLWECSQPGIASTRVLDFRKQLLKLASAECKSLCASRGPGCVGAFDTPNRLGSETDASLAERLGKDFGCRKDCGGPYFVYAAVYDANYRTEDPKQIANQPPNCKCLLIEY